MISVHGFVIRIHGFVNAFGGPARRATEERPGRYLAPRVVLVHLGEVADEHLRVVRDLADPAAPLQLRRRVAHAAERDAEEVGDLLVGREADAVFVPAELTMRLEDEARV